MITKTSNNDKLYATWKKDHEKNDEVYLIIESETYPLRLKLDTFNNTSGEQNLELVRKGVRELLSKLNICCHCCDMEKVAEDVVSFLIDKSASYTTLMQWFTCEYKAVYE